MKYTVIAPRGAFRSVEEAAFSENSIDWWNDEKYADQRTCTVAFSATELKRYLPAEVVIEAAEDVSHTEGRIIILGTAEENPYLAALEKRLGKSLSCKEGTRAEGYRIFTLADAEQKYTVLSGADRIGTLYAAYAFLELSGVHFIEPGEPQYTDGELPDEMDITEEPDFITRATMSSFITGDMPFLEWMAHNKFNCTTLKNKEHPYATQKKLGISSVEGGHRIFYMFVSPTAEYPYRHALYGGGGKPLDPYEVSRECRPPSGEGGVLTYGDAHPEWYAKIGGVRRMLRFDEDFKRLGNAPGDNICTSNPDCVRQLCEELTEALTVGVWRYADYLNLWPLDNGAWCECESCQAIGNYSRRILMLAYELNKFLKAARKSGRLKRNIRIICPAYHETMHVPSAPLPEDFDYSSVSAVFYPIERCFAHDLYDPICTETNRTLYESLMPWTEGGNYRGELVIGEYYNVSTFAAMPFVLSKRIANEIPFYYEIGARHFHYMHITARDWGIIAINNYLHAKLIWNKKRDAEKITDGYFRARYGSLAKDMRELYGLIERASVNCKYYKHYQFVGGKRQSLFYRLLSGDRLTEENLFPLLHMRLRSRADDVQAGPSLKETLEMLTEAENKLGEIIKRAPSEAIAYQLERDRRRLGYGVRMTEFLYLMCLCLIGEEEHRERLVALAESMAADTESMMGYDYGENLDTALGGSWVAKTYLSHFAPENSLAKGSNATAL